MHSNIGIFVYFSLKTTATQKEIAVAIGKSERTVKSITARLTERGIIRRTKGKGSPWEIKNDI